MKAFLLMLAACAAEAPSPAPDAAAASCASLGCPAAPSGSSVAWAPCTGAVCWCGAPAVECTP